MNIRQLTVILINLFIIIIPLRAELNDHVPVPVNDNLIFLTATTGGGTGGGTDGGGTDGGTDGGGTGGGTDGGGTGGGTDGGSVGNRPTEVYNLIGKDILIVTEKNKAFSYKLSVDGVLSATKFSLVQAPSGMTINSNGVISWTPTSQSGYTTATIRVVKSYGARVDYIVNVATFLGC